MEGKITPITNVGFQTPDVCLGLVHPEFVFDHAFDEPGKVATAAQIANLNNIVIHVELHGGAKRLRIRLCCLRIFGPRITVVVQRTTFSRGPARRTSYLEMPPRRPHLL